MYKPKNPNKKYNWTTENDMAWVQAVKILEQQHKIIPEQLLQNLKVSDDCVMYVFFLFL